MNTRKIVAIIFIGISLILGVLYYLGIQIPDSVEGYFEKEYYNQFGPLAIAVELLVAGVYLFKKHPKANFALALFGFTAVLDPIFNLAGLFTSMVPIYAMVLFTLCAVIALWLSFTNTFELGKISFFGALWGFVLGNAVELFFNYW
ncbi:hypothetical protein [Flagellimonas sp.]|uniref:hypothetical protein n=1 Tax=Flagellimonas sp. TaxID=2058762 RepID=UPI003B51F5C3